MVSLYHSRCSMQFIPLLPGVDKLGKLLYQLGKGKQKFPSSSHLATSPGCHDSSSGCPAKCLLYQTLTQVVLGTWYPYDLSGTLYRYTIMPVMVLLQTQQELLDLSNHTYKPNIFFFSKIKAPCIKNKREREREREKNLKRNCKKKKAFFKIK